MPGLAKKVGSFRTALAITVADGVVTSEEIDASVEGDRCGAGNHAIVAKLSAGETNVGAGGLDDAIVDDTAIDGGTGVADLPNRDVEPAQRRIVTGVSAETDLQAGCEDDLTIGAGDVTLLQHVTADEGDAPADAIAAGGTCELSTGLHLDVARDACGVAGSVGRHGRTTVFTSRLSERGEEKLLIRIIEQSARHEVGVDG